MNVIIAKIEYSNVTCGNTVKISTTVWELMGDLSDIIHRKPYSAKRSNTHLLLLRIRKYTDQKKLRIWTLFTQCHLFLFYQYINDLLPNTIHVFKITPANIQFFKINNRNTRKRCKVYSNLTMKTKEGRHWRHSGSFTVNFEHISHHPLVFLLLILNK